MTKKIFIFSTIIFLIGGVYFIGQFFLFKEKPVIHDEDYNKEVSVLNNDDKKNNVEGRIENIIEGELKGVSINLSGDRILYFNQGNFLSMTLDGLTKTSMGAHPFNSPESIEWSSDNKNAIIKDLDGYHIFNFERAELNNFKSDADNLIWGRGKNQVFYKFYDENNGKRSLNVSNLTGTDWQELVEIPFRDAEIKVNPENGNIALFSAPTSASETQLFIVNPVKKEKKEIEKKYKGANYKWSPDGKKLLFSYTKDSGGSNLAVLYVENNDVVELNFPGLVDKCVWSANSIDTYCAGLTFNNTDVVIPDDWYSKKAYSTDIFWKINTEKGEQQRIVELDQINEDVDATSLILDESENFLFFIDRKTENLFRISLDS